MTNVETLCRDWIAAKQAEAAANRQRIAIEGQIGKALEARPEGAITHTLEHYKVTLTQPVTRKLDADEWEKVKGLLPENLHPIKTKVEADATGCKWMAENEPTDWRKIASAFETKQGKLAVKVEEI